MKFGREIVIGGCLLLMGLSLTAADKVVAKVNGEPIYEQELDFPLPEGRFRTDLKILKEIRLERLIQRRIISRLLERNHIVVTKVELDQKWADREKTPPSSGCACCNYPSLNDYLQSNYYKPEEYLADLANELGYEKFMIAQWNKVCPPGEARKKLMDKEKPRLLQEFTKASHIFFNVTQRPEYTIDPAKTQRTAQTKADAAWQRLQRGADFVQVAKEVSEDANTRSVGGVLTCIPLYAYPFGNEFINTLSKLKPGEYSKPVESAWGYHIIRRETMNDNDILTILQETFMVENWNQTEEQAVKNAKVERSL